VSARAGGAQSHLVLLRGVNVSGRNRLPMADLRALLGSAGFGDVRTYLQSGNVCCTATGTAATVADAVSALLRSELGLAVPVVARTAGEWASVVAANPLVDRTDDPTKLHATFLDGVPDPGKAAGLSEAAAAFAPEELALSGAEVYLFTPAGYGNAKLQNDLLERRLGRTATTRNWRTVLALADLAGVG
jgi:uncharacterized protein (DUF1697 family)